MTDGNPIWLSEADVEQLLTLEDAIEVLHGAHVAYAQGRATSMERGHVEWGESILHAVGGVVEGMTGTKTWTYTPAGAQPVLVLFDAIDGRLAGVVEAFGLGKLRTAATTGLGTQALAREDSSVLALLGTGKQALTQARAVAAVRPLAEVRVFGRDPGRRAAMAAGIGEILGVATSEFGSPAEAVAGADVVVAVTRSREPILAGEELAPGQHVNAVGAIVPTRAELAPAAVGRCDVVVVDSRPQAEHDSKELRDAVDAHLLAWEQVGELGAVLAGNAAGRADADQVTLFKGLGVGLADVALGTELLRRGAHAGAGAAAGPAAEASTNPTLNRRR